MRRKKELIASVLILVMASSMASCKKKQDPQTSTETSETTGITTEETTSATTETTEDNSVSEPLASRTKPGSADFKLPEGCSIEFPEGDIYHYNMDLKLDTENQKIGGNIQFEFYNDSDDEWNDLCMRDYPSLFIDADYVIGMDAIYLEKPEFNGELTEIDNISDSRTGALEYSREEDDPSVIWIDLDQPLKPGEWMTLTYDFSSKIPDVDDRFGYYEDIYNITNFYPILAEYVDGEWSHLPYYEEGECFYSEISTYQVTLEVPSDYIVLSSGETISEEETEEGIFYEFEAPFVRDFVFCTSNVFEEETREYDGVTVNVVYSKENPPSTNMKPSIDKTFSTCENSLKAFGDAFGKYPYDELDVVVAPISAGGMEYPNLVIITSSYYKDYNQAMDYIELETCVSHEIGHQWFMGIVGSNSAGEPWLDESFASYTELVYCEYVGGDLAEQMISMSSKDMLDLTDADSIEFTYEGCLPLDMPHDSYDDSMSYIIAAYKVGKDFLYQIEECIGTDEFHLVLREYVHRNAFTNATTADFLEVLYEYAGTDNEVLNKLIENCLQTTIG